MQLEVGQLQKPIKAVLKPLFNFAWRVSTDGLENIPTDGGAIIAPNHLSVLDSFFVPCSLPRRITYVGKAEYLDDWKTKYLFPAMGMIPIDRRGGSTPRLRSTRQRTCSTAGAVWHLPGGHPQPHRRPAQGAHRHRSLGDRDQLAHRAGGRPWHGRGATPRRQVPAAVPQRAHPLRSTDLARALPRPPRRSHGAASADRRGDVRDPPPDRPGLRRHLRHQGG
ncbi:MAG: 1-acyl-sn-glycerol-3-phosphate acyltransferase [Candidatus Microthrix sp.]|nr:1-acyl-sn-glycerol-3-phosphate acyltransferase [Candidatus Microthrix sp.]